MAQITLAAVLVQLGFVLRLTGVPVLDMLLTLFWLVGVTNAFNLLDNMDGLAAGMAVIAGVFRLVLFLFDGNIAAATMTAGFVGAVAGFLVRNAPPARIFMGDAGSLFLGFFLGGLCLVVDVAYYSRGMTAVLAVPVLLVLIPIFDTTFVTITRLLRGQPVSQGGRDHTSHRLVALGGSERRALAVLFGLSIVGGGIALLTYRADFGTAVVLLPLLLVGLALLGVHLSRVEIARASTAPPGRAAVWVVRDFPYKRQMASVVLDTVLIVVAYYAAYVLRFEDAFAANRPMLMRTLAPVLVCQLAGLALSGAYSGMWRYTGLADMLRLTRGITIGTMASRPLSLVHDPVRRPVAGRVRARTGSCSPRWSAASRAVVPAARRGPARPACRRQAGSRLRGGRRRGARTPGAPQQPRPRPRGRGLHRRRPGEGRHADPRGARARTAGRPRRAHPGPSGRGGRRRLEQDSRGAARTGSRRPASRTEWSCVRASVRLE